MNGHAGPFITAQTSVANTGERTFAVVILDLQVRGTSILVLSCRLRDLLPVSLTHGKFDIWVLLLAGGVVAMILYDLAMAILMWFIIRADCLIPLSRSPLRWGFTWIKGSSWRRIWDPGAASPDRVYDYLARLRESNGRYITDPILIDAFDALRKAYDAELKNMSWAHNVTEKLGRLHEQLAESAQRKIEDPPKRLGW